MSYQPKDGHGALFPNDKGDNPARPDYRGDVMIGGVLYELAGWKKMTSKNTPMLSLAIKPKEQQPEQAPQTGGGGLDSDIPFAADR